MYKNFIKPLFDFVVALSALLILSPVLILTAVALAFVNQGNPFFLQRRPGKNERIFKIIKFKTMNDRRDSDGKLLSDAERLTSIGKVVRKTSLDEIPQLLNVLKGDMSLIGPRPLLPQYLELYTHYQNQRHLIKPGITGWAQVNGRNAISWSKKLDLDVWYVRNMSLWLDLRIVWLTVLKVMKSEGITTANMATTEPFNGNN